MEQLSLKAARVNAGLTQQEVAKTVGVAKDTLIDWEKGRSYPRMDYMDKMCQLYKVNPSDIFLPGLSTFNRTE